MSYILSHEKIWIYKGLKEIEVQKYSESQAVSKRKCGSGAR